MIVEERIYTLQVGTVPEYLRLYEAEGLAIQKPILGNMVGYFTTEFGPLNQIIHMWGYADLNDRARRRAQLAADPGWQAYIKKVRPFMITQENKLLIPASFSPHA
jgi:hypothetical protein